MITFKYLAKEEKKKICIHTMVVGEWSGQSRRQGQPMVSLQDGTRMFFFVFIFYLDQNLYLYLSIL